MAQQKKAWAAIIMMIALFAMIAFVTNLCSPMSIILKNEFGVSAAMAQIGNVGNFIAYLVMGIPSGMLINKMGYKKTALLALIVGIIGIVVQWAAGAAGSFAIYLVGALIAGFCMCMLNTVVNPMLNLLGGGGNAGNQLIQIGGVFNSAAAVAVYIIMGALIGDATKAHVADATPALMIAIAIFVIAFIVLFFTKIEEPEQAASENQMELIKGAFGYRHFVLGTLGIFLYMGIEVGVPTSMLNYLVANPADALPGYGMDATVAGLIAAVYWLMMLVGRFVGGALGSKFSSRSQITFVASVTIILLILGIMNLGPDATTVSVIGIDWGTLTVVYPVVPLGVFFFILVGLCTSVMWGGIFNMAVEGLGKYTAAASGIFMTMVFGCAVLMPLEAAIADAFNTYAAAYVVIIFCAAYLLFYALIGSKPAKKA